jgi:hypothetical protein
VVCHLEQAFLKTVELTTKHELRMMIEQLSQLEDNKIILSTLQSLIELGNQQSASMYSMLDELCTVQQLVALLNQSISAEVRVLALRALSSVCCTVECIRSLEACSGVDAVAGQLAASPSLEERMEAAGVLAQVTSPWITDNHHVEGLTKHVPKIVSTLTGLARLHCGDDSLLLVTAALANLSFMEATSLQVMNKLSTMETLLDRASMSPFTSVFVRDQVVTVMANMAAECREEVMLNSSLEFLASQLETRMERAKTPAEQSAVERILKKSAIALCRVCQGEELAQVFESMGVVQRAVELCKFPFKRNYSDSVLVACLALLRRVGSFLPHSVDQSLLQESLVHSFREFSIHQESYV